MQHTIQQQNFGRVEAAMLGLSQRDYGTNNLRSRERFARPIPFLKVSLIGLATFAVAACGGGAPASPEGQSSTVDIQAITTDSKLKLSSGKIDVKAALGLVPAIMVEIDPCPFLSDETALQGVSTQYEF